VVDENKMIGVCDKLIGVFMVDKPTPTDWRRLLAFSREWDNIRPHFFARCNDKAVSETDPVLKEKLLRLARKLKVVCFVFKFATRDCEFVVLSLILFCCRNLILQNNIGICSKSILYSTFVAAMYRHLTIS